MGTQCSRMNRNGAGKAGSEPQILDFARDDKVKASGNGQGRLYSLVELSPLRAAMAKHSNYPTQAETRVEWATRSPGLNRLRKRGEQSARTVPSAAKAERSFSPLRQSGLKP